jgi:hypothetical protein
MNFFEALEYCHNLGMSLATMDNDAETDIIDNYLNKCQCKKAHTNKIVGNVNTLFIYFDLISTYLLR